MSNPFSWCPCLRSLVAALGILLGAEFSNAGCLNAPLLGVNLAGAEFGGRTLPGALGFDYSYPTRADLVYFRRVGMNTIRLPFRWERIQRVLFGPLDIAEVAQVAHVLAWAQELGLCVVLDVHNYASYNQQKVGSDSVPSAALADLWLRLAAAFPDPAVAALGLMNEPAAIKPSEWIQVAQSTVLALRSAGAQHLLLVGSGRWSGAHEWEKRFDGASAAEAFTTFEDPLHRYAIELHQYVDPNFSGTTTRCIEPGALKQTMQAIAQWNQVHQVRFFMGEFGMATTPDCLAALHALLAPMQDRRVWLGWTYWAAGARWGKYPFSIHPGNLPEAAQLGVLREYLSAP